MYNSQTRTGPICEIDVARRVLNEIRPGKKLTGLLGSVVSHSGVFSIDTNHQDFTSGAASFLQKQEKQEEGQSRTVRDSHLILCHLLYNMLEVFFEYSCTIVPKGFSIS